MEIINKYNLTNALLFILFFISLQEFGIQIQGDGVSINYFYIMIPLVLLLIGSKHELSMSLEVVMLLIIFSFIYVVGIPHDINNLNDMESFRRFASYATIIAPFSLAFINFDSLDLRLFKISVIVACTYYSLLNLYDLYYWMQFVDVGLGELKGKIGSQRYGFVLLLGFYATLFGDDVFKPTTKQQIMRFIVLIVIFCGIFLTYSKTTIAALVLSLLIFLVLNINIFTVFKNFTFKRAIYTLFFLLFVFLSIYAFIVMYLDVLLHVLSFDVNDHETSLGFRIHMFDLVMQFIAENPIFGSNYQGIYALYDQLDGGSVHNQFLDMLLRVGIVGFIIWAYVIFKVLMSLKTDNALFYGMISIIIFGLMHETFKLAWGGFIFGMLVSFSYSSALKFKEEAV